MKGLELKIKFKNSKAYLTENKPIIIQEISLNQHVKKFQLNAYWKIRVIEYIDKESRLFCEILSYNFGESEFDNNQKELAEKLNQIKNISFNKINTHGLISTILKTSNKSNTSRRDYRIKAKAPEVYQIKPILQEPIKYHINKTLYVTLTDVSFNKGFVSFESVFNEYPKSVELKIFNDNIREEYDAIKDYFGNILRVKKIEVIVSIDIEDNKIISTKANSPEIDRINKQLIDEVKINFVKSTIKKRTNPEKENRLLTIEEYFESFTNDDFELKTFYNRDEDFLEDLLKISETKHYKHLRFLSRKHSQDVIKLRYLHKPFSFIFLIKGIEYYHFVWETLNTEEATYIWHIRKENDLLNDYLVKIEQIIKAIKIDGKRDYISNTEDKFNRIYHDYSDPTKGFIKWKEELENLLV